MLVKCGALCRTYESGSVSLYHPSVYTDYELMTLNGASLESKRKLAYVLYDIYN